MKFYSKPEIQIVQTSVYSAQTQSAGLFLECNDPATCGGSSLGVACGLAINQISEISFIPFSVDFFLSGADASSQPVCTVTADVNSSPQTAICNTPTHEGDCSLDNSGGAVFEINCSVAGFSCNDLSNVVVNCTGYSNQDPNCGTQG